MFAALAVPNFRRYVSGQALSPIGTRVETAPGLGAAACLAAVIIGGWPAEPPPEQPNREE